VRRTTTEAGAGATTAGPGDPCRVLEALLGMPFTEGNRLEILHDGDESFPALWSTIDAAERSIDMLWFLWGHGEVTGRTAQRLAARARAGVRVRVLLDGFGARGMAGEQLETMREAGCHVLFRRPIPTVRLATLNRRSHRRVLVCDETVAFTGGLGIDSAWSGHGDRPGSWRDTDVRVEGPAVDGIRAGFVQAWVQAQVRRPGSVITQADHFPAHGRPGSTRVLTLRPASQPGWNEAAVAITALLHVARERVRISSPYARIPGWLGDALVRTAERGVQVQLTVPGPHVDRRMVQLQSDHGLDALLAGGVEVWRFQPTLLHSKVVTVDSRLAMLGTTNLDVRSLALNEQIALLVDDPGVVADLDRSYEADLAESRRLTTAEWRARPRSRKVLERLADVAGRPLLGWGAKGLAGREP
jgi:cardiolipin synthase A/B